MTPSSEFETVAVLLKRHNEGSDEATTALLGHALSRLRRMSRGNRVGAHLKRWYATSDIVQGSSLRLWKALKQIEIHDPAHFYGIVALQFRRQIATIHEQLYGASGRAIKHATDSPRYEADDGGPVAMKPQTTLGPQKRAVLADLYRYVSHLPEDEQALWDLIIVHSFSYTEASELLGCDRRTIARRWMRLVRQLVDDLDLDPSDLEP